MACRWRTKYCCVYLGRVRATVAAYVHGWVDVGHVFFLRFVTHARVTLFFCEYRRPSQLLLAFDRCRTQRISVR